MPIQSSTNKMVKPPKESLVYLKYFAENKFSLFLPVIAFAAASYLYSQNIPVGYRQSLLYEVEGEELSKKLVLTDQVVAAMRQDNIISNLKPGGSSMKIYKSGPYLITLVSENTNQVKSSSDLEETSQYMETKFPLLRLGKKAVTIKKAPMVVYVLTGTLMGFLIGNIFTLARIYFHKY